MDREKFNGILKGYWESQILFAAMSLGIFDLLKGSNKSSGQISDELSLDPRGTKILVNSLVSLGFLGKRGSYYRNSPFVRTHLLTGSREALTGIALHMQDMWDAWGDLTYVVKKGKPRRGFATQTYTTNTRSLYNFALAMHQGGAIASKEISLLFDFSDVSSILDVGGCTGRYALSIMKRSPAEEVHVLDLPEMVREAEKILLLEKRDELEKIRFIRGSFFNTEPGYLYDLVIISNILHSLDEDDSVMLLTRARKWLTKEGALLVHDFTVDSSGTTPHHGAIFAVNMLVNTKGGRVYTEKETLRLIRRSGYKKIDRKRTEGGALAILCS